MNPIWKQIIAYFISVIVAAPIFTIRIALNGMESGAMPWMAGSLFLSLIWAAFLMLVIAAPVATITRYMVEHRMSIAWQWEPLVLLGVMVGFTLPLWLYFFFAGNSPPVVALVAGVVLLSLYFPTLVFYSLLRAMDRREYI